MFFQNLDEKVKQAITNLTVDQEFQKRFSEDKILDELDEEKFNPAECFNELLALIGSKFKIGNRLYKNITPLAWSYLWCLENPIVKESKIKKITAQDVDQFFYIIENGITDEDPVNVTTKSFNYCEENNIPFDDLNQVINTLLSNAFHPLKMFPTSRVQTVGNNVTLFDTDWLTAMISKVHYVTGYSPEYIMKDMTLSSCCFYYIQYCRMKGVDNIVKRTPDEILDAQDRRACELVTDRLIELKIVDEKDREKTISIMTTKPENNK